MDDDTKGILLAGAVALGGIVLVGLFMGLVVVFYGGLAAVAVYAVKAVISALGILS